MPFCLAGLLWTGLRVRRRKMADRTLSVFVWLCLSLGVLASTAGCGRSAAITATPGTSTFQIVATSGNTTVTLPVTLTIQ